MDEYINVTERRDALMKRRSSKRRSAMMHNMLPINKFAAIRKISRVRRAR